MNDKFYITTPIYYVTAKPHLGSLYSTLLADVIMRWQKLLGKNTFFLTGTDEHGQKIAQAAAKEKLEPKKFIDSFVPYYKGLWRHYRLDYTYFIRTTDEQHVKAVQLWLQKLIDSGDIYKDHYEGWYCVSDEAFVPEAVDTTQAPACPLCGRETIMVSEESYFFRLSAYQDRLLAFYEAHPDFIVPHERAQEVINFVKSGLRDLSISRTTVTWGIPFPDNQKHVTYVWADALNNYITAIGYGQPEKEKEFNYWWPADVQILGKDILRFHAIYWPAFLMASDLPLPKQLLVHGWIKVNNEKMSKSRHNVVDPKILADTYGVDQIRYYLMRQMSISQDSNFSIEELEQRITADLAYDLSNLLNRMSSLTEKNQIFSIPVPAQWSPEAVALYQQSIQMLTELQSHMNNYVVHLGLATIWKFIAQANAFFHAHEPWKLIKEDKEKFLEVCSAVCHSLRTISMALWPVMPSSMEQLLQSLGVVTAFGNQTNLIELLMHESWDHSFTIQKIPVLFNKIEKQTEEKAEGIARNDVVEEPTVIEITDFAKMQLRVGTIDECETIAKSDKLYKLQVNFGSLGTRQVLSGIRHFFSPEELKNKQAVFVYNLKPRQMMGLQSQGMILTAKDDAGKCHLIVPQQLVPNGTLLQ